MQRTLLQKLEREPTAEELAERSKLFIRRVCDPAGEAPYRWWDGNTWTHHAD